MKVCTLGSGSEGNCTYVESGDTRVLIDAGFSAREVESRLSLMGADVQKIDAIVVTHEHSDHIRGVGALARRHDIPVYANAGTFQGGGIVFGNLPKPLSFETGGTFHVGDLEIRTFSLPHDTNDPVGVAVKNGGARFSLVTDLGYVTPLVREAVRGSNILFLEANHDLNMLISGPYPWELKQRIKSRFGHLSNDDSFYFLKETLHDELTVVVMAHLSKMNNHRELVKCQAEQVLGIRSVDFEVAPQDHPGKIHSI